MNGEGQKLDRILALSEENNKMLKKLVRSMRWARFLRILYLVLIIGSAIGVFYFLQPFVDQVLQVYGGFRQSVDGVNSFFR